MHLNLQLVSFLHSQLMRCFQGIVVLFRCSTKRNSPFLSIITQDGVRVFAKVERKGFRFPSTEGDTFKISAAWEDGCGCFC